MVYGEWYMVLRSYILYRLVTYLYHYIKIKFWDSEVLNTYICLGLYRSYAPSSKVCHFVVQTFTNWSSFSLFHWFISFHGFISFYGFSLFHGFISFCSFISFYGFSIFHGLCQFHGPVFSGQYPFHGPVFHGLYLSI